MTVWMIEPRDTLVLRDGRPMSGDGLQMMSLPAPYSSAVAGFFRTRSASDDQGRFKYPNNSEKCSSLLQIPVRGPWFAEVHNGQVLQLVPAPRDVLPVEGGKDDILRIVRLGLSADKAVGMGELTNLPAGMRLVEPEHMVREKPVAPVPLWYWSTMLKWLTSPQMLSGTHNRRDLGLPFPGIETRMNVKISPETLTGEEGKLFSVEHRRYQVMADPSTTHGASLSRSRQLVLVADCAAEGVSSGTYPFAGERRLVRLTKAEFSLPSLPEEIGRHVSATKKCRVVLLTPAEFKAGWKPEWLLQGSSTLKVMLRAAIVPHPEVVSGWDLLHRRPKPTRRLVPAGSVFFLEFEGDPEQILSWVNRHWWQTVSDGEQSRLDGFGLCAIGVDEPITLHKEARA